MNRSIFATLLLLFAFNTVVLSQDRPIKIVDERLNNRLMLFALNENDYPVDVSIKVEGTGFRQPKGKPRLFRVPAASKVNIANLIVERGKRPVYTYDLTVNDSLSRRVIRKPATQIKIDPRKNILVYLKDGCTSCDSLVQKLDSSYYNYRTMVLEEKPEVKEYLIKTFRYTKTPFDSIQNPIVSLGGTLYTEIENYEQLMAKLKEEKKDEEPED